jgi:hypothetical protein
MALLVEGKRRAAENAHADRAWLAWTIAALGRAKKMPSLKEVAGRAPRERKRRTMSADQLLTMARMWSAVAGPEKKGDPHE